MSIPLSPPPRPFWNPDRHADRRAWLLARGRALQFVRAYFSMNGFLEVEPSTLQRSPGNETHLHGFETRMIGGDGQAHRAYLHTSPEFAMKKLLAAGETKIFALSRVFRNRERGVLHSPEFTMLEWYRVGEPLHALERDCEKLAAGVARAASAEAFRFRNASADPFESFERVSVRDAFLAHAGIDLFDSLPMRRRAEPDRETFARQAVEKGIRVVDDDSWSDIFSRVLCDRVEPKLGLGRLTILNEYPLAEAALARPSVRDPRVCERFELYACGVELANVFGELTDPEEQRRRFEADMALRARIYGDAYPIDEDFLAAVGEMPEASGAALGFDRIVMLACGADRIEDVQWTPVFDPASQ